MKKEEVIDLDMYLINSIQTNKSRFEKVIIIRKDEQRTGNRFCSESDVQYSNKQI